MKKLIVIAALCAASSLANAAVTQACSGTAGTGTPVAAGTAGTAFILQGFTPRCSNNVSLHWDQTARAVGVGSSSTKGGVSFRGNSEGGAVAGTACGTNKRCDGTESSGEATKALGEASS